MVGDLPFKWNAPIYITAASGSSPALRTPNSPPRMDSIALQRWIPTFPSSICKCFFYYYLFASYNNVHYRDSFSNEDDMVEDFFCGSGGAGVATMYLGRNSVCIDKTGRWWPWPRTVWIRCALKSPTSSRQENCISCISWTTLKPSRINDRGRPVARGRCSFII